MVSFRAQVSNIACNLSACLSLSTLVGKTRNTMLTTSSDGGFNKGSGSGELLICLVLGTGTLEEEVETNPNRRREHPRHPRILAFLVQTAE
mmetsp:Transcript_1078/g.2439  ORF Transcript_1078/g.2439 Transcript_1078/m.2439 type:complete len:91 (-) Transcript_1078:118-390(-)